MLSPVFQDLLQGYWICEGKVIVLIFSWKTFLQKPGCFHVISIFQRPSSNLFKGHIIFAEMIKLEYYAMGSMPKVQLVFAIRDIT